MASCSTGRWVNTSPYVQLIVNEQSSDAGSVVLSWTLQYVAEAIYGPAYASADRDYSVSIDGSTIKTGKFNINNKTGTLTMASGTRTVSKTHSARSVSFGCSFNFALTWGSSYAGTRSGSGSIDIGAKTSYTISYDLNSGSGSFGSQTKWYGESITLHGHTPTRTGYTFGGWSTTRNGSKSYDAGSTYTNNAAVTLYAIWARITYAISFNANGGTLVGSSTATKTYDVALTLPSATRTNYRLLGWSTSSTATSATYTTSYTTNAAATLYAVWEVAYTKPVIMNYSVDRCDENGAVSDTGTYAIVKFDWSTYLTATSIVIDWGSGSKTITPTGSSGTVNEKIGNGAISIELTYTITVTVSDGSGSNYSSSRSQPLSSAHFIMDIAPGGKGITFGGAAETNGFNVKMDAHFHNGLSEDIKVLISGNCNEILTSGNYYIGTSGTNKPGSGLNGWLTVKTYSTDYCYQEYVTYTGLRYQRLMSAGTWGAWTDKYNVGGKILWQSGVLYMAADQSVTLPERLQDQTNGIVLVFCPYQNGQPQNYALNHQFISKYATVIHNGCGMSFFLTNHSNNVGFKYLYITDNAETKTCVIQGDAINMRNGTNLGINYGNDFFVLKAVIGV